MINPDTKELYLLDLGLVHFRMPIQYLCPFRRFEYIQRFCVVDGDKSFVPFKVKTVLDTSYNMASFLNKFDNRTSEEYKSIPGMDDHRFKIAAVYQGSAIFQYLQPSSQPYSPPYSQENQKCTNETQCIKNTKNSLPFSLMSEQETNTFQKTVSQMLHPFHFIETFFAMMKEKYKSIHRLIPKYAKAILMSPTLMSKPNEETFNWSENIVPPIRRSDLYQYLFQMLVYGGEPDTIMTIPQVIEVLNDVVNFEASIHHEIETYRRDGHVFPDTKAVADFTELAKTYRPVVEKLVTLQQEQQEELFQENEIALWSSLSKLEGAKINILHVFREHVRDSIFHACVLAYDYSLHHVSPSWEGSIDK